MVNILQIAYSANLGMSALEQLVGYDDVETYRFVNLRRLGAGTTGKHDEFADILKRETSEISADARQAADAWAQDTYQR